ncbi:MAG: hypothetical protein LBD08_02085, partial [Treponema sp.]|nr:hypothetical protein [Treponema sp.]
MTTITIDPSIKYQTIEGFGASDCWTAQFVGRFWNEHEKETIARLLFSRDFQEDGSPQGIGLSMWRFNLGAGTLEQGDASGIKDLSRRAESFLDETGRLDFSKQAGQQWFLRKARDYGVEQTVAFSNAPPIPYSRNGKGYSSGDGTANLRDDAYNDFAEYLAACADHFSAGGLPFTYLSPVNEPQHDWKDPTQEGSPWENQEIKRLTEALDRAIQARNLEVKILLAEAGKWNALFQAGGRASHQIYEFFDRNSPLYIGEIPSLARVIGGHSYWTHTTDAQLRTVRTGVRDASARYGLGVFQTEWSMLDAGEGFPGYEEASYMDIALFMAKVIHADMVYANAASWSFWTSMDMERWGHKNRFLLVALNPGNTGDPNTPITEPGAAEARSTLWALGNYSFFV